MYSDAYPRDGTFAISGSDCRRPANSSSHFHVEAARQCVEVDDVTVPDQSQGTARCGFGADMQDAGASETSRISGKSPSSHAPRLTNRSAAASPASHRGETECGVGDRIGEHIEGV